MTASATSAMTRSLDEDEKGVQDLHTPGGDQAEGRLAAEIARLVAAAPSLTAGQRSRIALLLGQQR